MFTYQMCYFYASKMINRKFIFNILTFLQHGMAIKSVQNLHATAWTATPL